MEENEEKPTTDLYLARALLITADSDLRFLDRLIPDHDSSRRIVVNYYDVLRAMLEAIAARQGRKIYRHSAFIGFLNASGEERLAADFSRLRKIRNRINYYGKEISPDHAETLRKEFQRIIAILRKKYLRDL